MSSVGSCIWTKQFERDYNGLNETLQNQIDDKIRIIKTKPDHSQASLLSDDPIQGLRRYRVYEHRIVYMYTRDIVEHGVPPGTVAGKILDVFDYDVDDVFLVAAGHRGDVYDRFYNYR